MARTIAGHGMGTTRALTRLGVVMAVVLGVAGPATTVFGATYELEVLPQAGAIEPQEPFTLTIKGQWPIGLTAATMDYADALSDFSVQDVRVATRQEAGQTLYEATLQLQVAQPGLYVVRPLRLPLLGGGQTQAMATSQRLFLEIPEGAAAAADLRPNKPLQDIPWHLQRYWWVVVVLLVLAGTVLGWLWWRRRRQPPPIDPYAEWLSGLRGVRETAPPDAPIDKQAAFELSHAIRQYIERCSTMSALEMTGGELARAQARTNARARMRWQPLVDRCRELETIKYRPGAVGEQSIAQWVTSLSQLVDAVEADLHAEEKTQDAS